MFIFNSVVSQGGVITINLNSSYYWWGDGVKVSGEARKNGGVINSSQVEIYLEGNLICNTTTDIYGKYACELTAPSSIGNYNLIVKIVDSQTGRSFINSTNLIVKIVYGIEENEMKRKKQISCHEVPWLVVNPDGSIKYAYIKVCVTP